MKQNIADITKQPLPVDTSSRSFLLCGLLSSSLYIVMNVLAAILYEGYDAASQTVSELSAIDAPTRRLWVSLAIIYSLLVIAFGYGIRLSAKTNRSLRRVGWLFMVNGFIGFFWPPMHQREVLAAGGGSLTDSLHILFTIVTVCLMILSIVFGAIVIGRTFRIYSIVTLLILIVFGILTGMESSGIETNSPTPSIGVWERINIGAYMVWVMVLSVVLSRREKLREQ